ncbi:MAG: hypothetical protein Q8L27_03245 [archaeon]|nr:hypothetical protein [archaeon]
MTLDDVTNISENLSAISGIVKTLQEDSHSPQARQNFIPLYQEQYNDNPETRIPDERIPEINAEMLAAKQKKRFISEMDRSYPEVITKIKDENLRMLAHGLPDKKNKKYMDIIRMLSEGGDILQVRRAYANLSPKNEIWVHFCMNASEQFVKEFVKQYISEEQQKFEGKCLSIKDKETYKFNDLRARDYISSNIKGLKGEEKNQAYLATFNAYTQSRKAA